MMNRAAGVLAAACLSLPACSPTAETAEAASPASALAAAAAEASRPFEVERSAIHTLRSASLGRSYDVYVKTPPGYGRPENAARRYPVVYLLDGPYAFQLASGLTRMPFNQKALEEFVLVGLAYAEGEDGMASRSRDYTPFVVPGRSQPSGGAAAYLAHLKTEVLPMVEGRYRLDASRRTLSGQSYGGLFGLYAALTEPTLFSSYILTSPSIWFADGRLRETEAAYAASHKDLKADIYLATGALERPGGCTDCRSDMVRDQEAMARQLRARNYPGLKLTSEVIPGTVHELTYPIGLTYGLQRLFSDGRGNPTGG